MQIKEHDCVILTHDLPAEKLQAGDVGVVLHIHQGGVAYEVEFVTLAGETIAVVTVAAAQVRPVGKEDVRQVREMKGKPVAYVKNGILVHHIGQGTSSEDVAGALKEE